MVARIRPAALAVAALCALAPAAEARKNPDAGIESALRMSYNYRAHLKDDAILVACRDGVVSLTGSVANDLHKALAEETAYNVEGVRSVDDRLVSRERTPAQASDAWLAVKVRTALRYHRSFDPSALQVAAKDGVVALTGEVGSAAEKELAGDIARNVDGVADLDNRLRIATAPPARRTLAEKIDDASVTAQVKAVLLAHRGTHMLATRVRTDRGVVILSGRAQNPAEKELVSRLVADVRGVKRIDNQMTLQPDQEVS